MPSRSDPSRCPVVLDTHTWIWLAFADARLRSSEALAAMGAARERGELFVSAISVWEVGLLVAKGRLHLETDCLAWVRRTLDESGIDILPLSPEIAVHSNHLPGKFHGDPADRIIVASTRKLEGLVVTADERILDYGRQGYVNAMSA